MFRFWIHRHIFIQIKCNNIFKTNPSVTLNALTSKIHGKDFARAGDAGKLEMATKVSDDVAKYLEAISKTTEGEVARVIPRGLKTQWSPPTGKNLKNIPVNEANISATSVSDITGIPRATCIRKLDKFVKMKILEKDEKTKRYSLSLNQTTFNPMLQPEWMKHKISILSEFSSVLMRGLVR